MEKWLKIKKKTCFSEDELALVPVSQINVLKFGFYDEESTGVEIYSFIVATHYGEMFFVHFYKDKVAMDNFRLSLQRFLSNEDTVFFDCTPYQNLPNPYDKPKE